MPRLRFPGTTMGNFDAGAQQYVTSSLYGGTHAFRLQYCCHNLDAAQGFRPGFQAATTAKIFETETTIDLGTVGSAGRLTDLSC